jgi:uncharacterized protein (DUF2384 family)
MTAVAAEPIEKARVLTDAVARIAELWGLSNARLGAILGVSMATASRLRSGQSQLDPASKSHEAAQFLLRLFRSLDALLGSDDVAAKSWLATENLDLGGKPIAQIETMRGLMAVCDYVDFYRARV